MHDTDNPFQSPFEKNVPGSHHYHGHSTTSGFGIASVALGLLSWLIEGVTMGSTIYMAASGNEPEESVVVLVGLAALAGMGIGLLAAVFGFVGLMQKNRGRALPVIGLLMGGGLLVAICGVCAIGWSMSIR